MRRILIVIAMTALTLILLVPSALAASTKYTFTDVTLRTGATGEIEATVKTHKNKDDSVYCGYFTDDYAESLGYYFDAYSQAPTDPDAVLQICLDEFEERNT